MVIRTIWYSAYWFIKSGNFIDRQIDRAFDGYGKWPVHAKVFPLYKFVDLYRAAQTFVEGQPNVREICSQHDEPLARILNRQFNNNHSRMLKPP